MDPFLSFNYTQSRELSLWHAVDGYPSWMVYQSLDKLVPSTDTSTIPHRTLLHPEEVQTLFNAWPQLLHPHGDAGPDFAATDSAASEMPPALDENMLNAEFGYPFGFPEFDQEVSSNSSPEVPEAAASTHTQDMNVDSDEGFEFPFDFKAALMPKAWELRGEWYSPGSTPRLSPAPLPALDKCRNSTLGDNPALATPLIFHPTTSPRKRGPGRPKRANPTTPSPRKIGRPKKRDACIDSPFPASSTSSPVKAKAKAPARKRAPRKIANLKKGSKRATVPSTTLRLDLSHMVEDDEDEYVHKKQRDENQIDDDGSDKQDEFLPGPSKRDCRGVIRKKARTTSDRPRKIVKKKKVEADSAGYDADSYSD